MVWGTYIRMRMLLRGAARVAEGVDVLLFVDGTHLRAADPHAIAHSLRTAWGVHADVSLALRSRAAHGGWRATLRGVADARWQRDYGDAGMPEQAAAVRRALRTDTDLVVAHRMDAAFAVVAGVEGRVPTVMNFDDIEHVAKRRRIARLPLSPRTLVARAELTGIERAEVATLRAVTRGIVCSDHEREHWRAIDVRTPIDVVPNGISFDTGPRAVTESSSQTILFIGSYGYEPNIEAAEELIRAVFPRVRRRRPEARLVVAGAQAERLPAFGTERAGVTIVGFVEDVATLYREATVVCCPIRAGGGTRIKIVEAAAWRVPVVSTPLGAEGLGLRHCDEILLAESPEALADACVEVLQDRPRAQAIGEAAHRRLRATYDEPCAITAAAASFAAAAGRSHDAR